jgi:two-component system, response regulator, stage 0 sporulation protein A
MFLLSFSKVTVVIADDSKEFASILTEFLSVNEKIEIVGVANDGIEAFNLVQEKKPDLMLLDMIMPKLDGLGVLEKLNSYNIYPRPKIIVLSALGQDRITQRAIELGADYYAVKPFDIDVLVTRMLQMCADTEPAMDLKKDTSLMENVQFSKEVNNSMDLENQITDIMHQLGIPANIKGYMYLRTALKLVFDDTNMLAVTKMLYPEIAKQFHTTPGKVERAIRHAIEIIWTRGNISALKIIMGHAVNTNIDKPTNAHLIASIADSLRLKNR